MTTRRRDVGGFTARRRIVVGAVAALVWAVARAGVDDGIVNTGGWSSFRRFWRSAADLEVSGEFLRLTVDAATLTLSYAVLGTVLSVVLGCLGALVISETLWGDRIGRRIAGALLVVPRAVHEILWALLLVQVLGFDPLVAVIAIGVPFGAVTAKVYAETIDEADQRAYRRLSASGAGRLTALAYGIVPEVRGELISYAFYRFECAIRSAAVLGIIGAGGLGFQLDLSFESLRYDEIWTLIVALMILSGLADTWSSRVRRSRDPRVGRFSLLAVVALVPLSWRWIDLDPTELVSARTRRLGRELLGDLFPARLGPGGWRELIDATVDTVAMSVLATAIAAGGGLALAIAVRRRTMRTALSLPAGDLARVVGRGVLLLFRAVPAPVWAFVWVLVLFPGPWPGAVALGIYNLGVLGRLFAETLEDADVRPADMLVASGANHTQALWYGTLPTAAPRLVALAAYRWEVIVRETVVVGVVGAGGLGQLINEHLAARDFAAVTGAIGALVIVTLVIDRIGAHFRRHLR
ncbi:MAG: ABC transporter permease subunit [Acidimicrobiales bacterium]